jgi:hypothetical protein
LDFTLHFDRPVLSAASARFQPTADIDVAKVGVAAKAVAIVV